MFVAFLLRLTLILLGNYFIALPDSYGDTFRLEKKAWEMSQNGFFGVFKEFPSEAASYHFSWILAFIYSLTDRSPLLGQSMSLIMGMGSIFLAVRLAHKIWSKNISITVGWVLALYPTLILYSSLILREAYVWFFLLIAIYGIISWCNDKSLKSILISFIGFFLATFYHGGMFIGGLVFTIILASHSIAEIFKSTKNYKISLNSLIILGLSIIIILYYFLFADDLPKKLTIKNLLNIEFLLQEISMRQFGDASYPDWLVPNSLFELLYKTPIRLMYFLFSPFLWDINKASHLFGLLDGLIYLILFFIIFKNINSIWYIKILKIILIILFAYLIFFGISSGNFGTGLRHRTKFFIILILIVAPWLPKFSFKKNVNNK